MGNLVMPKNSADAEEMLKVLEVYDEANDFIENHKFIEKMKQKLGEPYQEPQAYTKKGQIPSYFGFTTWEDSLNPQSRRKITDSGKRFLAALKKKNNDVIYEEILKSLETKTFGRNALGVKSDSDIEPPQLFIKCVLVLGHLKRQEFGYILESLDNGLKDILDLLLEISINRSKNKNSYTVAPTYGDAKPITALVNWKFFKIEGKEGGQDKIIINPEVKSKYIDRLESLPAFNRTQLLSTTQIEGNQDQIEIKKNAENIIFYGPPGTGKSFQVNKMLESNDSRIERVTFHPEFDYSSFVGAFKPTMVDIDGQNSEIRYEFSPQVFTKIYVNAWNDLSHEYYLVIEEINRGNCSEIFGDIFQLLDRSSNYSITPSKELQDYLEKHLRQSTLISANKMKLPPNLSILATMNTSDQSLFPMDSAFKRRWNWQYVPIDYDIKEDNPSSNFVVNLSEKEKFLWVDFIKNVNNIIKNNPNLGMDKCIGNYFVKPDSGIIDLKTFVNKVLFYLWNDVFKDEIDEDSIFKNGVTYEDLFPIDHSLEHLRSILDDLGVKIHN